MSVHESPETEKRSLDDDHLEEDLAIKPTQTAQTAHHDVVFGEISEDGPNYRNVGFVGTVILMMKSQIGLGILSIPSAFNALGMVPGVIVLCGVAALTTWSDYVIGHFKLNHREVYGIDDAAALMFGPIGRWVLSVVFCLYYIFVSASGILGLSIGLNAVSTHGLCTVVFAVIAAILGFATASVRTLGRITWLAWVGLPCVIISVMIVTIAVSLQDRPSSAPKGDGPWTSDFKIVGSPTFVEGVTGVSNLIFAFSGTPGFFAIVSEMRNPRQFTSALLICQATVTSIYLIVACIIYYYCGSYVSSPALGSAGGLVKQISYGIALPGLVVTTTIVTHIPAKYMFVHILRGSRHLTSNSFTHWITWLSCTLGVTVIAYIIASTIPAFDALVSLIGALLGTILCLQPYGCMWLYDNWSGDRGKKSWWPMVFLSVFVVAFGSFVTVGGTYGTVIGIMDSYKASGGASAFSCADNSNST
ncbi:unnamed protein product [Penicillium salamii]|uniref:Amino acid transporter transmembrane domain-containing protein n=1 Tax=Penicillium salamii TaxID=1612424 RepID=A0A9W4I7I5_9EURO|nr:unnamed protein product [Penicillium salamii]CAG8252078.1 unnamed protein product [Penicillium salamii]CAG8395358.1 unnamed protein product [Penicillium salamii]